MSYTIVMGEDVLQFVNDVGAFMGKGWIPQGGLCLSEGVDGTYFMQAMIKKD